MKKHLILLSLCFAVQAPLCSFSFSQAHATAVYPGNAGLDLAKVDSFFSAKSIDVHQSAAPGLYYEIYKWYKTRYSYGGNSSKGIDCSHFVNMLYEKTYEKTLGPSVGDIYDKCHVLKKGLKKAEEGDLVFFRTKKGQLSHVGIYLQNGKFAHASTHAGVIISDMDEPYYKKHFYKIGRVKMKDMARG